MLQGFFKNNQTPNHPVVRDTRTEDETRFLEDSKSKLQALESVRRKKFEIYKYRKKIAIPLVTILTPFLGYADYWLYLLQSGHDKKGAGLTIAFLGIVYGWVTQPKREYAATYKKEILPALAKLFGDFEYKLNGKLPMDMMQGSKIIPSHDRYEGEDFFSGHYKGVNIAFSEVNFQQKHRSKNSTYYVSVFKGLAILLDMKTKRFLGHTILGRDKGKILSWFKEKSDKMKRADLVDPEFEKLFDVYTSDQVEARYLIDPAMIERIKGLQTEYQGESLTAAFYDSKMLILIRSKHNHFEPADISIPATDPQSVLNMKREIGEILSVIDRLNLYDPAAVAREQVAAA